MSVLCSFHNLAQLEGLNQDLERHCYALNLMMQEAPSVYSEEWYSLMLERVNFLEQTCWDLRTFEHTLRQGKDFT